MANVSNALQDQFPQMMALHASAQAWTKSLMVWPINARTDAYKIKFGIITDAIVCLNIAGGIKHADYAPRDRIQHLTNPAAPAGDQIHSIVQSKTNASNVLGLWS